MKKILLAISAIVMLAACSAKQPAGKVTDVTTIKSPDSNIEVTFQMTEEGTPQYALKYGGEDVILPSNLGFELRGVLKAQKIVYNPDGTISKEDREPCTSLYDGFVIVSWNPPCGMVTCKGKLCHLLLYYKIAELVLVRELISEAKSVIIYPEAY